MTTPALLQKVTAVGKASVNILLVDDQVRNLEALESILDSPDYRLVRAQSAQEALMALIDGEFAAIVLDIQMPGTSGIELANLIKHRKKTQLIPIIFVTAFLHDDKDILQGYQVGAVDYLTKPIDPTILKSKVAVFVELFQKTRELAALNVAMGIEITQRQQAEEKLQQANTGLEARVQERTERLMEANDELRLRNTAVQESERRYGQLISSLPAAVYTTDAEGRVTLFNEAAVVLWGRRPEVGKDLWCGSYRIFRPDGTPLPLDQSPVAVTLREGRPIRGEEIIVECPDGTRRNVLPYPDPIRNASGKIVGAVNMLLDITESKRAEEASRRLAAIVESSDDAIVSKDLNGIIASWNRGAERLFGYRAEEVIGKPITILLPPEAHEEERNILRRIRRGERLTHFETIRRRKDGSLVETSLTVSPIKDAKGNVVGASKIARDITKQKRSERQLERAHEETLATSRAKDDFLAALSHELRTPLNPVLLLASEAAHDPSLSPKVQADFAMIAKNVMLEARLIDDLLDLTRISRGKLSLDLKTLDVHAVLSDAIATVREEMARKKITLNARLAPVPPTVRGDEVRLQQVFWNLLQNAVKFTPVNGTINVQTRMLSDAGSLAVVVSDTGIGLTETELSQVFSAFAQGEHALTNGAHKFGGLGLGLAITRKLVESHGGTIVAASEGRDRGATFTITLPLFVQAEPSSSPQATPQPSNGTTAGEPSAELRILLVEDHEPSRTALTQLLVRRRHQVAAVATIAEARALAGKSKFDLVISDIGLPDGSGYELMAELQTKQQLSGIALTGYGMEYDIARSQMAGFLVHLTKPIRASDVEAAIATVVAGRSLVL